MRQHTARVFETSKNLYAGPAAITPFDLGSIDWDEPSSFYLEDTGLEDLSDVTIKHSGLQLPAHSHILAQQSGVLRQLFRSLREQAGPAAGSKRRTDAVELTELETPFSSHSLQETVLLLRHMYNNADATTTQLEAVAQHLPGITRLAHSLDARRVLVAIQTHVAGKLEGGTKEAALEWLPTAEECQLDRAFALGVRALARAVLSGTSDSADATLSLDALEASQQLVQPLSPKASTAVLAALAAALAWAPAEATKQAADMLMSWPDMGVRRASYTWRIPNFRQQQDWLVSSGYLEGSGERLYVCVHPAGTAGNVSIHLRASKSKGETGILANCTFAIVDQTDDTAGVSMQFQHKLTKKDWYRGFSKFISHQDLDAKADKYLVGGTAVFRVHVKWLEMKEG